MTGRTVVRPARDAEVETAAAICDAAMLETDPGAAGTVLVAVADGHVLGALVAVDAGRGVEIDAVAVRRRRRGQGIGTALVEAVAGRHDRVVASFDGDVRPFYEKLGFEIEPADAEGRYRGVSA